MHAYLPMCLGRNALIEMNLVHQNPQNTPFQDVKLQKVIREGA
jgi:hypothetical protein